MGKISSYDTVTSAGPNDLLLIDKYPITPTSTSTIKVSDFTQNQIVGPASSTNQGIVRYSGTTGKLVQDSNGPIIGSNGATVLTTNNEKTPLIMNGLVGYGTNNAPLANEIQFKPQNTFYGYGVLDWYCEDYTIKDVIMQAHRVEYTALQSPSDPTQPVNPDDINLHRHWSLYTSNSTRSAVIKRLDIPYFVDYADIHFQNGYLTADSFGNNPALTLKNPSDNTTTAHLVVLQNQGAGSLISGSSLSTGNAAVDLSGKFGYKHTMTINNGAGLILTTDGTHTTSSSFGLAKLTNLTAADSNPTLNIDNRSSGKSLYIQNNGSETFSITSTGTISVADAQNLVLGTTTGTKIGTVGGASGQKLAFYGSTPVVQPLLATGAGHTVDDVITALQTLGLVRQS